VREIQKERPVKKQLTNKFLVSFLTFSVLGLPNAAAAQELSPALPPLMNQQHEINLALSAAPTQVSENATVLVLRRGAFESVREGSNGFTCLVDRYFVDAIEPMCLNLAASNSILPVLLRRNKLREQGATVAEIDEAIELAFQRGELRLPHGLALSYMLSASQDIIADNGRKHGQYVPHLMIYVPYVTEDALGGRPTRSGDPTVFRSGQRGAAIIVPIMGEFVQPVMQEPTSLE